MTGGIDKTRQHIVPVQYQTNTGKKSDDKSNSEGTSSKPASELYPRGAYIPGTPLPKKDDSRIVVIDYPGNKDIDGDKIKEPISHADQVVAYLPQDSYEILNSGIKFAPVAGKLKSVRERVEQGENIGAVNMSIGSVGTSVNKLKQMTGINDLTAGNIKEKSSEIIDSLRSKTDSDSKAVVEIYDETEKLAQAGVPVIVAAGNDGPNYVNLFALNPNAIVTGSRDSLSNFVTDYSATNSTVDISIREVTANNIDGKFDYNNDGVGEIPVGTYSKVRKQLKKNPGSTMLNFTLSGTSYAAPQASKVAKWMHDQGISVTRMNEIFAQTNAELENNPTKNWEELARSLAEKELQQK